MTSAIERAATRFPTLLKLADHQDCIGCRNAQQWWESLVKSIPESNVPDVQLVLQDVLGGTFTWGPTDRAFHWCDLLSTSAIDSSVQAALASKTLSLLNLEHYRTQYVLEVPPALITKWKDQWVASGFDATWILDDRHVYREGVATLRNGVLEFWDTTDLRPLSTDTRASSHRLVAVRFWNVNFGHWRLPIVVQGWMALDDGSASP